ARHGTFDGPRVAQTDRPALWQSLSPQQIFLVSPWSARINNGPAATVSTGVPDLHYYCNRGGKDIIPLYRDAHCAEPNITRGILKKLSEAYDRSEERRVGKEWRYNGQAEIKSKKGRV